MVVPDDVEGAVGPKPPKVIVFVEGEPNATVVAVEEVGVLAVGAPSAPKVPKPAIVGGVEEAVVEGEPNVVVVEEAFVVPFDVEDANAKTLGENEEESAVLFAELVAEGVADGEPKPPKVVEAPNTVVGASEAGFGEVMII